MIKEIQSTVGGDMADKIEAAARAANDGDTLLFTPMPKPIAVKLPDGSTTLVPINQPFLLSRPIDLTCSTYNVYGDKVAKRLNIVATGATFYAQFALSGAQAMITWGAPVGMIASEISIEGGSFIGSLCVRSANHSRVRIRRASSLILRTDTQCSYNAFDVGSLDGAAGNGTPLYFDQTNDTGWINANVVENCSLVAQPVNGTIPPIIVQTNAATVYPPGVNIFRACRFEGNGQRLFGVHKGFNCIMDNIYAEGDVTQGDISACTMESFTWSNMPAKWASWLSDPRNIHSGVLQ